MSQLRDWDKEGERKKKRDLSDSSFILFMSSADWIRPAHTGKGICFTQSTN
jgi:hypothetical protein